MQLQDYDLDGRNSYTGLFFNYPDTYELISPDDFNHRINNIIIRKGITLDVRRKPIVIHGNITLEENAKIIPGENVTLSNNPTPFYSFSRVGGWDVVLSQDLISLLP